MREILFRGKRVDNGEWVQGYLSFHYVDGKNKDGFIYSGKSQIYVQSDCKNYDVITETVGQYTGLKDRNGVNIFEGDECTFGIFTPKNKAVVNFEKARFILVWGSIVGAFGERARHSEHLMFADNIEVVGNIHDKKESEEV